MSTGCYIYAINNQSEDLIVGAHRHFHFSKGVIEHGLFLDKHKRGIKINQAGNYSYNFYVDNYSTTVGLSVNGKIRSSTILDDYQGTGLIRLKVGDHVKIVNISDSVVTVSAPTKAIKVSLTLSLINS